MSVKFTGLPAATAAVATDLIAISHDPSGTPVSQKLTLGDILSSGAGDPASTPVNATALYIDTNTGTLWMWYSGAWH